MAESSFPLKKINQNGPAAFKTAPRKSLVTHELVKVLESDEYGSQILSRFHEFREDGKFCDVTLCVEDQSFRAHKMVLAGCSDYFRALFSHGMKDSDMDNFDLADISLKGFRPLLDFTYTGKLRVNFDLLPDVLGVATFLQMRPAIKLCQVYLKAVMTLEDADDIVNLGMHYGLTELKDAQRRLILDYFLDFAETRKFYEMDYRTLIDYLKDDSLRIKTEGTLLKCVLRWYKFDRPNREAHIGDVLNCVRFVQQGWPIIDFAEKIEPFTANKECKSLISFSVEYMQEPHRKHLISDFRTKVRFERKTLIQIGGLVTKQTEINVDFPFLENIVGAVDNEKVGFRRNFYYHKPLSKWIPLGCIGTSDMRSHCPLVYVNDHCILVGGYVYTQDFSQFYQHCSNEIKLLTVSSGDFSMWDMPFMNEPRAHHAAVSTPTFIYALGGKNESGSLRSVEQFHMDSEIWGQVKPLPEPLYDHAAASVGETVYVSGGVEGGVIVKKTWSYSSVTGVWAERPPMLHRRAGHTMTRVDCQLIVCGGLTNSDSMRCLSSVESYDVELEQWSLLTPMRQDCAHMAATVLNGSLVVLGGVDSVGDLLKTVQQYDFSERCWSTFAELQNPMQNAGVCALTVKLTDTGDPDTDSLCDEYENKVFEGYPSDDEYPSHHSDDELEVELMV